MVDYRGDIPSWAQHNDLNDEAALLCYLIARQEATMEKIDALTGHAEKLVTILENTEKTLLGMVAQLPNLTEGLKKSPLGRMMGIM